MAAAAGLAGAAIGLAGGGFARGLIGLGAGIAAGALLALWIAARRSEAAFFARYAEEHGLTDESGRLRVPPSTPLLRAGDERHASRVLEGELAPGHVGFLALYTYEEHATDGRRNRAGPGRDFTIAVIEVPESIPLVPELYCRRRAGLGLPGHGDGGNPMQPIELESAVLAERYEILVSEYQDPGWMRELFSPTFVVWLAESAPDELSFELFGGRLCCYVPGHRTTAAELDSLRAASAVVVSRIREESLE